MQFFGKQLSTWWLLLLFPLVLVCLPLLLISFFALNNLAGAIIGPPAFWNRTRHSPPREALVGRYVETERRWDQSSDHSNAWLELRSDGSMSVGALPEDAITSVCTLSGNGRWGVPDADEKINLFVTSDGAHGSCQSGSYGSFELVGQAEPYGLYWVLGDPDSGTGVWLKKQ